MKEKKFKTGYKWTIFWFFIFLIIGGCGYIVYSKQVPQFEFRFSLIQPKEKVKKKVSKIELSPLSLSVIDDVAMRDKYYKSIDNISKDLSNKNINELTNPELLSNLFGKEFKNTKTVDFQEISQQIVFLNQFKSSFYKIDMSGLGAIQDQKTKEMYNLLNLDLYFVYKDEQKENYLMDINFKIYLKGDSEFHKIDEVSLKEQSIDKLNLRDDTLLNQHSTFLTEWTKFQKEFSNEKLYNEVNIKNKEQQLKNQNLDNFVGKSNIKNKEALKSLFITSNGNLKNAMLVGEEVSNQNADGNTYYLYATSDNEKIYYYIVEYNRLNKKIVDIHIKG